MNSNVTVSQVATHALSFFLLISHHNRSRLFVSEQSLPLAHLVPSSHPASSSRRVSSLQTESVLQLETFAPGITMVPTLMILSVVAQRWIYTTFHVVSIALNKAVLLVVPTTQVNLGRPRIGKPPRQ